LVEQRVGKTWRNMEYLISQRQRGAEKYRVTANVNEVWRLDNKPRKYLLFLEWTVI